MLDDRACGALRRIKSASGIDANGPESRIGQGPPPSARRCIRPSARPYMHARSARPAQPPISAFTRSVKSSPRFSKFGYWSKLAAAGASSTVSPGSASAPARATARAMVSQIS